MPYIPPSTLLNSQISFNSGQVDFGNNRLIQLDNVKLEVTTADKRLSQLNSIKASALKRATFTVKLSGKVKSFNKEMFETYFGVSSQDGSGTLISFYDGQQSTLNPVFTAIINDDSNQPFQCQLSNAVITSMPVTTSMENYGEVDFALTAVDVTIYNYN